MGGDGLTIVRNDRQADPAPQILAKESLRHIHSAPHKRYPPPNFFITLPDFRRFCRYPPVQNKRACQKKFFAKF